MKLLVVSDVHGDYDALEQAYRAEKNVGAVIFLGGRNSRGRAL